MVLYLHEEFCVQRVEPYRCLLKSLVKLEKLHLAGRDFQKKPLIRWGKGMLLQNDRIN